MGGISGVKVGDPVKIGNTEAEASLRIRLEFAFPIMAQYKKSSVNYKKL